MTQREVVRITIPRSVYKQLDAIARREKKKTPELVVHALQRHVALARGQQRARRDGSTGAPRFGFRKRNGVALPDRDEQVGVDLMRRLRAKGKSLRSICDELETRGIRPRRGSRWHPKVVDAILARGNRPH